MQEIAEALKTQREAKGMTLDDLFQRTRINIDYLRALEAGQFDVLPNTYAKLFIKKYAQEVGLNVDEILARYDKQAPREEPAKLPPPPAHRERNFQPVILIAVGVFIVALLVWQINQQSAPGTASPIDATLSSPPVTQQTPPKNARQVSHQETQKDVLQSDVSDTTEEITDVTPSTDPSHTVTSEETSLISETVEYLEPLVENPSTSTSQPVTSTPEAYSEQNIQTEVLLTGAETPETSLSEPVAEDIQELEAQTVSEQIAENPIPETPVTPNPTSDGLTSQEQTPEKVKTEPIIKPIPVLIAPGNPIILSGIVQQTTQIVVKADGRTLFDGELQTGSRPSWKARESLELTLTNQNAIILSLQNQPLQFDDVTTQAIQLRIDRTQIHISSPE